MHVFLDFHNKSVSIFLVLHLLYFFFLMLSDLYSYLTKVASTSTLLSHNLLLLSLVVVELNIIDIEFHFIFKNIICKELNSSTWKKKKIVQNMIFLISSFTWQFLFIKATSAPATMAKHTWNSILVILSSTKNSIFKLSNSKRVVFCQIVWK